MIYMLEDEAGIRNFVLYGLKSSGMEAEGFETPSALRAAMSKQMPELLLLDRMLPEEDGLSVLKKLRSAPETRKLPVIMLTAKDSELDKVEGLDSGADDYIAKPFGMLELISRIKALLRRTVDTVAESGRIELGGLCVYPSKHEVFANGTKVSLTLKEYDMLLFLIKNKGEVFSRDLLLREIWGYDFSGESRTVDVHVRTLRQKLGSCGDLIKTIRGVGYKAGDDFID
ncbi:MAG: response regulator transcription factor [Ruminococcus sp.]|uniref:response regulator transcription factor n=1 Tax=Ruminococcus sp. TaxID=41978 RepID=UPI001B1C040B|nr:response regulator transcription factor [Ruminococcus sp.]MBO7473550.1 response regulator transcription factor [Ruminococcus sp.]MBP5433042.1 response regulator transcription factor [Ruminococcus sp.]